jgi:hypothetical protein
VNRSVRGKASLSLALKRKSYGVFRQSGETKIRRFAEIRANTLGIDDGIKCVHVERVKTRRQRSGRLTPQPFELLEVIGFRCQYIFQPYRQPFVAILRRLVDPLRVVAYDLPFAGNIIL